MVDTTVDYHSSQDLLLGAVPKPREGDDGTNNGENSTSSAAVQASCVASGEKPLDLSNVAGEETIYEERKDAPGARGGDGGNVSSGERMEEKDCPPQIEEEDVLPEQGGSAGVCGGDERRGRCRRPGGNLGSRLCNLDGEEAEEDSDYHPSSEGEEASDEEEDDDISDHGDEEGGIEEEEGEDEEEDEVDEGVDSSDEEEVEEEEEEEEVEEEEEEMEEEDDEQLLGGTNGKLVKINIKKKSSASSEEEKRMLELLRSKRDVDDMVKQGLISETQAEEMREAAMKKFEEEGGSVRGREQMEQDALMLPPLPSLGDKKRVAAVEPSGVDLSRIAAKKKRMEAAARRRSKEATAASSSNLAGAAAAENVAAAVPSTSKGVAGKRKREKEEEVIDLSASAKRNRNAKIPKVRLNQTWSVFPKLISFERGGGVGCYEALCVERAPKDEKSNAFTFTMPFRLMEYLLLAVMKIEKSTSSSGNSISVDDLRRLKPDKNGYINVAPLLFPDFAKSKYTFEGFSVQIENVVYKTASNTASFDAITITKSAGGKNQGKTFSVSMPSKLIGAFRAALELIDQDYGSGKGISNLMKKDGGGNSEGASSSNGGIQLRVTRDGDGKRKLDAVVVAAKKQQKKEQQRCAIAIRKALEKRSSAGGKSSKKGSVAGGNIKKQQKQKTSAARLVAVALAPAAQTGGGGDVKKGKKGSVGSSGGKKAGGAAGGSGVGEKVKGGKRG